MNEPNVIRTVTVPVGSLASKVFRAEREWVAAGHQLEQMLSSLFGKEWSDWEAGLGVLDVYDVIHSAAAVSALHRAGFRVVHLHNHPRVKFKNCACRSHEDPL